MIVRIENETGRRCTLKHALDYYDSMILIETCGPY